MENPDLLLICISAFIAVLFLLSVLAVIIKMITTIFPQKIVEEDAAVYAAIASVYTANYPGIKITKITEEK